MQSFTDPIVDERRKLQVVDIKVIEADEGPTIPSHVVFAVFIHVALLIFIGRMKTVKIGSTQFLMLVMFGLGCLAGQSNDASLS